MNYYKHYINLIQKRLNCKPINDYTELHHIIPKCCGGTNDKDNIIELTLREHYIAHLLLYKMNENTKFKKKLKAALICMSINNGRRCKVKMNSRLFFKLKTLYYNEITKKYEYKNEFHTMKEWSSLLNIPFTTIKRKILHGLTIELIDKNDKKHKYMYKGQLLTLTEIAKQNNMLMLTLYKRIHDYKMTLEDAIKFEVGRKFEYNGEIGTVKYFAEKYGLDADLIRRRMNVQKMTFKEAIEKKVFKPNRTYEYKGRKLTLREISKLYNINYQTILSRLRQGMNINDVIEKKINHPSTKYFIINDKKMTVQEIAKLYNLNVNTTYSRLITLKWNMEKFINVINKEKHSDEEI